MRQPDEIVRGPENSLSEIGHSYGSISERDEEADRRHPGTGPRPLRLDPEGERILRDFAVLDCEQSKTARSGLEADLVRLAADPPGPDLQLASRDSALHVSAEVLGGLARDMHRDEEDMDRAGEVRLAMEKARTGQTKDRCGCTEVRHGQPRGRSMSDATRFVFTAERARPNEVEAGLQEVRRRQQKVRTRDDEVRDQSDEVRVQSSTSRLSSVEDRAQSMTWRLVTDEVLLRASAFRFELAQDRPRMEEAKAGHQQVRAGDKKVHAGCKKVRTRRTEVRNAPTEVRFQSARVRLPSGTSRRRSSKASSKLQTAMLSHIEERVVMANTTKETNRPVAVLNLPKTRIRAPATGARTHRESLRCTSLGNGP
jgi:hypothetical protein